MTKATDNLLKNHLQSFLDNDLEALMADYTNESLLISQVKTYRGIGEIKGFFVDLMTHFPKLQSKFELDNKVIDDEFAYIVWHAATPTLEVFLGSDTFVVKNQKIKKQTFVGQMKFI